MPQANLSGVNLEYRLDGPGSGPVVLLSNSLAANLAMWEPQVPALVDAGYRVLRYDSRGHGASGVPPGPYTLDMLTDDAVRLLDHLDIGEVFVIGCSMGGMTAQRLATHHPDRIRAAVLDATACHMPQTEVWNQRIETVREGGMAAVVDATIDRWFVPASQAAMPEAVAAVREGILATPPEGFCACSAAIRDMDQRETITAITLPVLVIVGEQDAGTPPSAAREIHQRIRGSKLLEIPDAAHFVHMEHPQVFNDAVLEFLAPLR